MNLTPFALASASLDPGIVLLEASAGTGKTYTLVGLLLRMLLERRIGRLDEALVVTFTVAATDEMKRRLRDGLRSVLAAAEGTPSDDDFFQALAQHADAAAICRRALADFDQVAVLTIHGFCKRLLDEAAFESRQPFATDFETDGLPLLQRAAADALRLQHAPPGDVRGALLHLGKHTPASLVEVYRLWRRHPDIELPHATSRFPELARKVGKLVLQAQSLWRNDMADALARLTWGAKTPPCTGDIPETLRRFGERLLRDPNACLPQLLALGQGSLRQGVNKTKHPKVLFDDPFHQACDELATATEEALDHLLTELLHAMRARVEQGKQEEQVATFDDLLVRAHEALRDPARSEAVRTAIRARYRVALIDEFQDTDAQQYAIFSSLFADRTLFLIGDPKQAIYGFRGADLRTYLRARDDATRAFTLDANYRSGKALVESVNALFVGHPRAFVDPRIEAHAVRANAAPQAKRIDGDGEAALRWRWVEPVKDGANDKETATQRICRDVAAEAARLLRSGATLDDRAILPRDLAVLVRFNHEALLVQDALRAVGIPSAIGKGGDVLESDEVQDLRAVLLAIARPTDLRRVRAAMATRLYGLDLAALSALEGDEAGFEAAVERFAGWRTLWQRHGVMAMATAFADECRVTARYLGWHDGERRLTNLRQLCELLHGAELAHRLLPDALVRWFEQEAHDREQVGEELREMRLESDEDAVQILTAHRSKGLQYEVVFCPFLWSRRSIAKLQLAPTPTGHRLACDVDAKHPEWHAIARERLEEDVRLAYVALTRAKRRCYVHLAPSGKECSGSALAWLVAGRAATPPEGDAFGPWLAAFQKKPSDGGASWRAAIAALAAASGGAVAVDDVPEAPSRERVPPPAAASLQPLLRPTRRVERREQTSFTGLKAQRDASDAARDVVDDEPRPEPVDAAPAVPARGMFAFARGTAAGICLHALLEEIDLTAAHAPATVDTARRHLATHGLLAAAAHAGELDPLADTVAMVRALAGAIVAGPGCTLAALTAGDKRPEWEFLLPLATDRRTLADALAAAASPHVREQGRRLRGMTHKRLVGFLTGSADLVCAHDGRYWILDWKSNHLGNRREDYAPDRLAEAMQHGDYVLQYCLYALALHRQLAAQLPGYEPRRHLGGVCYVFVRGVAAGTGDGLFVEPIEPALVHALDAWAAAAKEAEA